MREDISLAEQEEGHMPFRQYEGAMEKGVIVLLCVWTIFQLYFTTIGVISAVYLRAIHGLFLLVFTFLLFPFRKGDRKPLRRPPLGDLAWIGLSLGTFGYFLMNYMVIAARGGRVTELDVLVAAGGLLCIFEAARRASGNLAALALVFFAYNWFGAYIPGVLGHNGFLLKRILITQFWGTQGVFGTGIGVSATYIFVFVLFGTFLKYSGFSKFISDMALAFVGQSAGGPAKVAVMASGFMGMMNGSAIANVATTGTLTIPLMKRTGYRKEFAAAVEAAASTGGQFTPPVMGAVAFVMAEFLHMPYGTIALAAVFPAFLYYAGLLLAVHLEAKKRGFSGVTKEHTPLVWDVLKTQGHLALPLISLITLLAQGYTPVYAATLSIGLTIVASWLRKETRMTLPRIFQAITEGAKNAIAVGMCCVIVGVIIGTVTLTGLGLHVGYWILETVGVGNIYIAGFFVMLLSVILGMGVPGVAAYVIVQVVAIPVFIKAGAVPLAAHLFCLMYACLSNITPPVAMSSYVASGIAGANQWKTALLSTRLGLIGFLIPFFFLAHPVFLLGADPTVGMGETLWVCVAAFLGMTALVVAMGGWYTHPLKKRERCILLLVALLLLYPHILSHALGLIGILGVSLLQSREERKNP